MSIHLWFSKDYIYWTDCIILVWSLYIYPSIENSLCSTGGGIFLLSHCISCIHVWRHFLWSSLRGVWMCMLCSAMWFLPPFITIFYINSIECWLKKIIHQNILLVLKREVRDTVLLEKEEIPENEAFMCRRGIRTEPYLLSSQENKSYKNSDLWPPLKRKANGNSTSLGTLLHIIT